MTSSRSGLSHAIHLVGKELDSPGLGGSMVSRTSPVSMKSRVKT